MADQQALLLLFLRIVSAAVLYYFLFYSLRGLFTFLSTNDPSPNSIKIELLEMPPPYSEYYFQFPQSICIGQDPSNDIVIKDNSVDVFHAKIYFKNHDWYIEDLNSSTGTFVESKKIKTPTKIEKDIQVLCGRATINIFPQTEKEKNS